MNFSFGSFFRQYRVHFALFGIFSIGGFLRFFSLSTHDPYTDEVLLGVRAIEMMDYIAASYQTTPWQWVGEVPWWMHLSFHDHPVLFFLLQHISLCIFGETPLGLRFWSALFGILSIALVFLLAQRLFEKKIGLASALLLAVSSYHIWVSRLGLQDGLVIGFVLFGILSWIWAIEKNTRGHWLLFGCIAGAGLLVKYTTLVLFPIVALHALIFREKVYRLPSVLLSFGMFLLVTAPIWLYNLFLFDRFGHLDFQLSALFGQEVSAWSIKIGREYVGGVENRLENSFLALQNAMSPSMLFLSLFSFLALSVSLIRRRASQNLQFLFWTMLLLWLWLLVIGGTYRFVVLVVPWLCLLVGWRLVTFWRFLLERFPLPKISGFFLMSLLGLFEIFFTWNTVFSISPIGRERLIYAPIRLELQSFGFNELNDFFDRRFTSHVSARFGIPEYSFLAEIQNKRLSQKQREGASPLPIIVVYDTEMPLLAKLWTFQRRALLDGWIMLSTKQFFEITGGQGKSFFSDQGIETILYVSALNPERFGGYVVVLAEEEEADQQMRVYAAQFDREPEAVFNQKGEPAFHLFEMGAH